MCCKILPVAKKLYMQLDLGMQAKLLVCWWISLVVFSFTTSYKMQNNWLSFEDTFYEKSGYLVNRFCAG